MTDVLRLVMFAMGGVGIGLALLVATPYARALTRSRGTGGLLGYHVVIVAASWVLLTVAALEGSFTELGDPLPWHFWVRLVGIVLGVVAMTLLLRHLRAKTDRNVHIERRMATLQASADLIRRQRGA